MRNLLALTPVLLLGACASGGMFEQPPAELVTIHRAAKERIAYQDYAKRDWRVIPVGSSGTGNCAVFAATTYADTKAAGLTPNPIVLCKLRSGQAHAYTSVNGWALDVRYKYPIRLEEQDCTSVGIVSPYEVDSYGK